MNILVLNSGSSSIKFRIYDMPNEDLVAAGSVEKIGNDNADIHLEFAGQSEQINQPVRDHEEGLQWIANFLTNQVLADSPLNAVGHRVVHGGEEYSQPVLISDEVLHQVEKLALLAPLHNPPNAQGIQVSRRVFPQAQQVAVFDTAFHATLPSYAFRYPIPTKLYEQYGIRVYGMHGTSHQYVAQQAADFLDKPMSETSLITIHLGNGCSMAAVKNGQSVDTSMGLSPLAGLMMGTRSGDIDPSIPFFLSEQANLSPSEIDQMLNHESGLKGITGENDLREVLKLRTQGDKMAQLALEMYCYRIKKYIGAYMAVLGEVDALVFMAGVGENSDIVRERSLAGLENLGVELDVAKNQERSSGIRQLQRASSKVKILVVPTNEELAIAQQTYQVLSEKN
ncbi:MAG: acetate kinase [Bacteroidota bacterium]